MKVFLTWCLALFAVSAAAGGSTQCPCRPETMWLDLIFVVESTDAVSKDGIEQIENFVKTALLQTRISQDHLRVGAIAYSGEITVAANLTGFTSTAHLLDSFSLPFQGSSTNDAESALRKATEMFQQDHRPNVRKVAVLIAASLNTIESMPIEIGNDFREDGGVLIAIEFVSTHGAAVPAIHQLASSGYVLSTKSESLHVVDLVGALCDANCYCAPGHFPLSNNTRKTPDLGCFLPASVPIDRDSADKACSAAHPGAHLAVVKDDMTNELLFKSNNWEGASLWLGGRYSNGMVHWDREGTSSAAVSTYSHPLLMSTLKGDCIYAKQVGSKINWYVSSCQTPQMFVCQSTPYSTANRATMHPHAVYKKLDQRYKD
ncbi:unnamed protein product, partial [Mesorhabditis spiculigera]